MDASVTSYPDDVLDCSVYWVVAKQGVMAVPWFWNISRSYMDARVELIQAPKSPQSSGLALLLCVSFASRSLIQALTVIVVILKRRAKPKTSYYGRRNGGCRRTQMKKAKYLFTSAQQHFVNLRRNRNVAPFAKPVESMDEICPTDEKHMVIEHMFNSRGCSKRVCLPFSLSRFLESTKVDELIVSMPIHDFWARLKSLLWWPEVRDGLGVMIGGEI